MTITRYRFTIRPPGQYHCPAGWVPDSMTFKDSPEQWNYGTVTYPEPLSYKDANHWSLDPDSGPRITAGTVYDENGEVIGGIGAAFSREDLLELLYDFAVGVATVDTINERFNARAAEYDIRFDFDFDLNEDDRSLPLWRDIPLMDQEAPMTGR